MRSPETVRAVHRTATFDRAKIRAEFERRFSCERMAREYVEIYKALAAAPRTLGSSAFIAMHPQSGAKNKMSSRHRQQMKPTTSLGVLQ
jgi:hypothetical protein